MTQTDPQNVLHSNMDVLPLVSAEGFSTVLGWSRQLVTVEPSWFPDTSYWVPGICAGWLYVTNSGRAFIEDFITNPDVDRETRYRGLVALEAHIVVEARTLGITYLTGMTRFPRLRDALREVGYYVSDADYSLHSKVIR